MEEDSGPKAPITRLRRRLSVELTDEVKSPSTPSTPTKKRTGRLAAKPQLDLIDENVPAVSSPKRTTKKSLARDIVESAQQNPGTPLGDKPAKRSTRVKSNTSIISETTQNFESPRAKRAARRNSQIVENISVSESNQITEEKIQEKEEETSSKNKNTLITSPNNLRKSPRLIAKINRDISPSEYENKNNEALELNVSNKSVKDQSSEKCLYVVLSPININDKMDTVKSSGLKKEELSLSSSNLISELDAKPKKINSIVNKTTSALDDLKNSKSKRHRTKSWTTTSIPTLKNVSYYSDNEHTTKKIKTNPNNSFELKKMTNKICSSDGDKTPTLNASENCDKSSIMQGLRNTEIQLHSPIIKKQTYNRNSIEKYINISLTPSKSSNVLSFQEMSVPSERAINQIHKKDQVCLDSQGTHQTISVDKKSVENSPINGIQSIVFIEDTDLNAASTEKQNKSKQFSNEDQRVPEVEHNFENEITSLKQLNESKLCKQNEGNVSFNEKEEIKGSLSFYSNTKVTNNDSCEPMDIDVTISDNVSFTDFSKSKDPKLENVHDNYQTKKSDSKMSISRESESKLNEVSNTSKRKSSISQYLEKTGNENKSTLIISQSKDVTTNDNESKFSKVFDNKLLSNSVNIPCIIKNKTNKKNISVTDLTGTPLKQKNIKKLGIETSTPVIDINSKNNNAVRTFENASKEAENTSLIMSKSFDSSHSSEEESEEDLSKNKHSLIDDEAEEVEGYKSGDSQNEDERQYEKENEVLEKGETLTSEDEISNDSSYEKDSFVVSSDEEDNELLSGDGDDLSMSDNELTMSAKSKRKFNERKLKEQKRASREMFEARHNKSNSSDKSVSAHVSNNKKNNRQRLDSSLLDSEDDIKILAKKNNRLRLDSSHDISINKSVENESYKIKDKSLSASLYSNNENALNEQEITASFNKSLENDPLSVDIKEEINTPQKNINNSNMNFTIKEQTNEIQPDKNILVEQPNNSKSLLQATTAFDDSSLSSENEEIITNYNSVLHKLNKDNSGLHNMSDKNDQFSHKTKKLNIAIHDSEESGPEEVIISKESNKCLNITEGNENTNKIISNITEESSSDSIDLQLLFPEDSSENEENNYEKKCIENSRLGEGFITLKGTEGKTSIREQIDGNEEDNVLDIFIDTTGTRLNLDTTINSSLNTSMKKEKSNISKTHEKNNSKFIENVADDNNEIKSDDAPIEIGYQKEINHNTTTKLSECAQEGNIGEKKDHEVNSKKRKRKSSANSVEDVSLKGDICIAPKMNDSAASQKKKRKIIHEEDIIIQNQDIQVNKILDEQKQLIANNLDMKKNKRVDSNEYFCITECEPVSGLAKKHLSNKRKDREDDEGQKEIKVNKINFHDKIHVPRQSITVTNKLADKPRKETLDTKKSTVVSTTEFIVENTKKRKNKPSEFLEESVYLNADSAVTTKQKRNIKKPKVLPFLPTAAISDSGFTTNFKINIIPQETQFIAQSANITNFKEERLFSKKIKRLGTYELYKKQRNVKMSKF